MTTYVYCNKKSQTALDLCKRLDAVRLRHFDGLDFWSKRGKEEPQEGDIIIPWGATLPALDGVKVLNGLEAGLPITLEDPPDLYSYGFRGITRFMSRDKAEYYVRYSLNEMVPVFGRRHKRHSGNDLLLSTEGPFDYWVFKYNFEKEFRFHLFDGKVIRTAERVPKEDHTVCPEQDWKPNSGLVHPWVRTGIGGWRFNYEEFTSSPNARQAALNLIKTFGLSFAVVDITSVGGIYYYTGFSLAPKLDEKGLDIYVKAIEKWSEKDDGSRAGRGGEEAQPVPPAEAPKPLNDVEVRDYINRVVGRQPRGHLIAKKRVVVPKPRAAVAFDIEGWAIPPPVPDVEPRDP